jgi:glycosyltransferase involved in cell wall biosynthesis
MLLPVPLLVTKNVFEEFNIRFMKKKKIAIIGTVGIPAKYGGFETLAEHLVRHMGEEFDMYVYCTKKKYRKEERVKEYLGAKLIYLPFDANGIWSIVYDCFSILHAMLFADVLMVLGVSGGFMLPFVKRFTNKKIIVSIDGIEWKRDKWSRPAKWYLWWAEKTAVKYSHADIADNESIQDYTAFRYKTLSNIIEYGADHTMKIKPTEEHIKTYPFLSAPYAFKVCRIEPENNIHVVLKAFTHIEKMPLVLIGNWNNSEYGRRMKQEFGGHRNIILLDPIYDQGKLDIIRGNCKVYVHGHSAGGTNPSLVEAMYLQLPVVAFKVAYNKTTTEKKAWYFTNAEDIISIINTASEEDFAAKATAMKEIANRRYTWKVIADKYAYLVRTVLVSKDKINVSSNITDLHVNDLIDMEAGHLAYPAYFYEKR